MTGLRRIAVNGESRKLSSMAENSKIEWTHHTFNPWWGCVKVSPGWAHCYAERISMRWGYDIWGPKAGRRFFADAHWREPLKWNRDAEQAGERRRVFCASMADVFEDLRILDGQRERLWSLIEATPWLDWLLLTKRPESILALLPSHWHPFEDGLPRHVWFGISAENQDELDSRWPVLESFAYLWYPSSLFVSAEPLLGPLNLEMVLREENIGDEDASRWIRPADWVIAGGESGPKARPMHPDWVRSIRDQCVESGVPFHFKQWGEWAPFTTPPPGRWENLLNDDRPDPKDTSERRFRVGRARAGRVIDGRTWDEYPDSGAMP